MIELRADQLKTVDELRGALSKYQSALLRGPCGFGKTVVGAYMATGAMRKRRRVIFGVHRRELARQTALTFEKFDIPFGWIMDKMPSDPLAMVQIASVDTLRNRPGLLGCDLFVPDEAHLWSGPTRQAIIDQVRQNGSHIVPLTATPMFPNGRPLSSMADTIVYGPREAWLIEQGFLAKYRAYAPSGLPDLSGLHTRAGEYIVSELEERFSKPAIYGDAVSAYRKFAMGRRMIGYCYSRKHGQEMAATFSANGVPAAFIDGETEDQDRRAVISRFADGKILVLFNCQLFREGFDLSAQVNRNVPIQAVGLYNPTKSLPMAIQMMMRGMRPQDGHTIILDHANILREHGFPDDDREWTLEGDIGSKKASGNATIPTVICGDCWAEFRARPKCPYCGCTRDIEGREVALLAAEIEEINPDLVRQAREEEKRIRFITEKIEERECRTFADWVALGKRRGHADGWARIRYNLAQAKAKKGRK